MVYHERRRPVSISVAFVLRVCTTRIIGSIERSASFVVLGPDEVWVCTGIACLLACKYDRHLRAHRVYMFIKEYGCSWWYGPYGCQFDHCLRSFYLVFSKDQPAASRPMHDVHRTIPLFCFFPLSVCLHVYMIVICELQIYTPSVPKLMEFASHLFCESLILGRFKVYFFLYKCNWASLLRQNSWNSVLKTWKKIKKMKCIKLSLELLDATTQPMNSKWHLQIWAKKYECKSLHKWVLVHILFPKRVVAFDKGNNTFKM